MENEIYQILKKHKLPLKKREEILADLLLLFSVVGASAEQLKAFLDWLEDNSENSVDRDWINEYLKSL
jgi:hypothetical protein